MTQKERLVELIKQYMVGFSTTNCEKLAEYLIHNGVIVPPCKVGDTVYFVAGYETKDCRLIHKVIELEVCDVSMSNDGEIWLDTVEIMGEGTNDRVLNTLDFGIDAFLARKEAEQALKEREHENNL